MEKTNKKNLILAGLLALVLLLGAVLGLCLCFGLGGNQVQTVHATGDEPPPWDDNLGEGYTVSFNSNGGAGTMTALNNISGSYTLPVCTFTPPSGKQFLCWAKNSTTGTQYNSGTQYNVNDDVTFYAIWEYVEVETTYIVTYKPDNETDGVVRNDIPAGAYSLEDNHFVAPSGKQFKAWNVNGTEKQPGDIITISENTIIVAVWEDVEIAPQAKGGLSAGAVVAIVLSSLIVASVGGFAVYWFVIKKKTWADFVALFKRK